MINNIILVKVLLLFLTSSVIYSQEFTPLNSTWLSIYFELQRMKIAIGEKIKEIDLKIDKNNQQIKEINNLLADIQKIKATGDEAQKKNATLAEPVAQEALITARENQKKLHFNKLQLVMERQKLDIIEENLSHIYKKTQLTKNFGFIKYCKGNVKIISATDDKQTDCVKYSIFNEGDIIITSSNGKFESDILDGRGKISLAPDSILNLNKSSPEEQIVELIKGKMYIQIEDKSKYSNRLREMIDTYRETLKNMTNWTDEKIENIKTEVSKKLKEFKIWWCKNNPGGRCNITPTAVIGVRGTKFVYEVDEKIIKVSVLEGTVEISLFDENMQTFLVPEGSEMIIKIEGKINYNRNNISNIERWWGEND